MEKDNVLKLADKIIAYRAKHNMSMKRFAEICNVSYLTIWNIEHDKTTPTRLSEAKINQVLNNDNK